MVGNRDGTKRDISTMLDNTIKFVYIQHLMY